MDFKPIGFYYYKQYDDNNFRFICSIKDLKAPHTRNNKDLMDFDIVHDTAESVRCSQSRVKRKIRELILCNEWDYFATWTVNSELCDRYSLDLTQEKMRKNIQKLSRKQRDNGLPKVEYILVTEKHKDGAFHFHGVIKNLLLCNYTNKNGYLSNSIFDELGNQSFSKIRKNKTACANYIMKYITKDSIQNSKGTYYFRSHGLKKPETLNSINAIDFNIFINKYGEIKYHENEFCKVCDVQLDRVPHHVLMYLYSNITDKKCSFYKLLKNFLIKNDFFTKKKEYFNYL